MAFQTPITIKKALTNIHHREYVIPAIQREFVWDTDQITRLFDSLMCGYPIGSFLFWDVDREHSDDYVFYEFMTHYHELTTHHLKRLQFVEKRPVTAILDGQQRLTALNIGVYGSYAEKLPRKWIGNLSAYPPKRLYLNLVSAAPENELGMEYDFRFLTDDRVASDSEAYWFPVSKITEFEDATEIFDYIQDANLGGSKFAFRTLSRLHKIIYEQPIINYFDEESQDLDKVLNIFIRVNSAGSPLSYSDLLLSIATAQWRDVEAREVIHGLVDELNATGQHFNFSKDVVLKAGLALADIPSIAFRVTNFNAANMTTLEHMWSGIANALRLAVSLLADFGFSERTLTADSVIIPLAYYLHQRHATESYRTSGATQTDRDQIRQWVVRSLLKPGIWGSGLDTLLLNLRAAIKEYGATGFPVEQIEIAMAPLGKSLRFDEEEIQNLLSLTFGDKRVFSLLSLLYPGMNFRNEFHVDHISPRSHFTRRRLAAAGIPEADIDGLITLRDRLPNLQLLEGPANLAKLDKLPAAWIREAYPDQGARDAYRYRHDLGDIPEDVTGFREFYEARRARLAERLRSLLGVS